MKVKIITELDRNIEDLNTISPLNLNEKVLFFLEKGFKPDKYGYLCKKNKYIRVLENGISIVNKDAVWKNGIVINENIELLHIEDEG